MAERLTISLGEITFYADAYNKCSNKNSNKVKSKVEKGIPYYAIKEYKYKQYNTDELSEIYSKLSKLEDIMEKYSIESVEELDKKLANFDNFMKGNKFETIEDLQNALNGKFIEVFDEKNKIWQDMVKKLAKTEKDRDTWHNACKLACEEIDCECMYGVSKENYSQYFYQQAKNGGE